MLYIPMYHYSHTAKRGNDAATLEKHFAYYATHFHTVLPGDDLSHEKPNICITFDDAYADFYTVAYPLLRQYSLRALLSVSPELTNTDTAHEYASWDELCDIASDTMIEIAAHGLGHTKILEKEQAIFEAKECKRLLWEKLEVTPRSFVYPFGKFTVEAHREIKKEYEFAFRIGGAANVGWGQDMLYRFTADATPNIETLFTRIKKAGYLWKFFLNSARGN